MIWEQLREDLILMNMDCSNSNDVFDQLGGTLVKKGFCKESYVDALKTRERDYPTGVDMEGVCFAMPHTDRTHVNEMAIAVGIPKEDVSFMHMGTTDQEVKARLILMLAVTDPNAHIDTLQCLIGLFQDPGFMERIREAKDPKEVIAVFKVQEEYPEEKGA